MAQVVIVGGHGKVGLRLSTLLAQSSHLTTSLIRSPSHSPDILSTGATPLLLSLEDSPISEFTKLFKGKDVVYFCAGAGGRGGDERTRKVDYEGAVKVFDAIEGVEDGMGRPRLVLLSAIDVRDPGGKVPEHYVRSLPFPPPR
jgi:nucleoside-diphosphate-sugar epimerase